MIKLKYCTFEKMFGGCITRFPNGTSSSNWPHEDENYINLARECNLTPLVYCQQHDFFHSWLAEKMFDKPSAVLWRAAQGLPPNDVNDWEEKLVYLVQRGLVIPPNTDWMKMVWEAHTEFIQDIVI